MPCRRDQKINALLMLQLDMQCDCDGILVRVDEPGGRSGSGGRQTRQGRAGKKAKRQLYFFSCSLCIRSKKGRQAGRTGLAGWLAGVSISDIWLQFNGALFFSTRKATSTARDLFLM